MREALSIVLAVLFVCPTASAQATANTAIQERVLSISQGAPVEVRLVNKSKLRGRLGPVTEGGFAVQTVKGEKIDTVQIRFDEVKSVKDTARKAFGSSAGKALLVTGIVIGVLFGIYAISCGAGGC